MVIPEPISTFIETVAAEENLRRKIEIVIGKTESHNWSRLGTKQFLFCHAVYKHNWQVFCSVSSNHKATEIKLEFKLPSTVLHTLTYHEKIPQTIDLTQFR